MKFTQITAITRAGCGICKPVNNEAITRDYAPRNYARPDSHFIARSIHTAQSHVAKSIIACTFNAKQIVNKIIQDAR